MKEKKFCEDSPEDSDNYHLRVREGDLVILGTDGIFDNLFEDEILEIVKNFTKNYKQRTRATAQAISKQIAEAAYLKSKQINVKTPFNVRKAELITEQRARVRSNSQPNVSLSPQST
jgi:hypothetical protein